MEVTLKGTKNGNLIYLNFSFNPCFNGSDSKSQELRS